MDPQAEIGKFYFCDVNAKIETFICVDKNPKSVWHKDQKQKKFITGEKFKYSPIFQLLVNFT